MEESAYHALAASEDKGWYYRARRQAVLRLFRTFAPRAPLRILDVGCGTGGSTQAWMDFGEVVGVEPSPIARQLATARFPDLRMLPHGCESLDPAKVGYFDMAVILCVLYHRGVKDPQQALQRLSSVQKQGGLLIWNEPAYPFLWRQHDRQVASGRRFYPREMQMLLDNAGYEVIFKSHLLAWAFPLALVLAILDRLRWGSDRQTTTPDEGSDHKAVRSWLGEVLSALTLGEWSLNFLRVGLPFGLSCLWVARKKS